MSLATAATLASSNNSFYLAARPFVQAHPQVLRVLFDELSRADRLAQEARKDAIKLHCRLQRAGRGRGEPVHPAPPSSPVDVLGPTTVADQQRVADAFFARSHPQTRERGRHRLAARRRILGFFLLIHRLRGHHENFLVHPHPRRQPYPAPPKAPASSTTTTSQVAVAADSLGYEGVLIPTGRSCEDPWVVAASLPPVTRNPRFWWPCAPACTSLRWRRMAATFDRLSGGALLINLVTGGDQAELEGDGVFLDHATRYEQSAEFIRIWREIPAQPPGRIAWTLKASTWP